MFRMFTITSFIFIESVVIFQAQSPTPVPGPLTSEYSFQGVSFHYPSNWIVQAHVKSLTVAPQSAFVKKPDGKDFVTHGFFLSVVSNSSLSLDEVTTQSLESIKHNSPQLEINLETLTHSGNPPWSSCGSTLDIRPPYDGTETGALCTYRLGAAYVVMMMFSPTSAWEQYRRVFEDVADSFSIQVDQIAVPSPPSRPSIGVPSSPRLTGGCESGHWISSVGGDGKIIRLEDGSMWEVDDVDTVDTAIWLPVSNVVVCENKLINVDDNESAGVTPIGKDSSSGTTSNPMQSGYLIQAAANDETFVIGNSVFKAKTFCFDVDKGDKVIFIEGSPHGVCVSAKFLNLRNDKICSVWCE